MQAMLARSSWSALWACSRGICLCLLLLTEWRPASAAAGELFGSVACCADPDTQCPCEGHSVLELNA